MKECIWCEAEICTNPDCPLRADYCPVPFEPEICKWEERKEVEGKGEEMTPMQAWHTISANLAELYARRRNNVYNGYKDTDIQAEVVAFKALQEMEERKRASNVDGKNKDNLASE